MFIYHHLISLYKKTDFEKSYPCVDVFLYLLCHKWRKFSNSYNSGEHRKIGILCNSWIEIPKYGIRFYTLINFFDIWLFFFIRIYSSFFEPYVQNQKIPILLKFLKKNSNLLKFFPKKFHLLKLYRSCYYRQLTISKT